MVTRDPINGTYFRFFAAIPAAWVVDGDQSDFREYMNATEASIVERVGFRVRGVLLIYGKQKTATSDAQTK